MPLSFRLGLEHKEVALLVDLAKASPSIVNELGLSDKALPEGIRDSLKQELGEEYGFIADAYAEGLRLGRRLSIKEARRMVKLDKANRIEMLKPLRGIE